MNNFLCSCTFCGLFQALFLFTRYLARKVARSKLQIVQLHNLRTNSGLIHDKFSTVTLEVSGTPWGSLRIHGIEWYPSKIVHDNLRGSMKFHEIQESKWILRVVLILCPMMGSQYFSNNNPKSILTSSDRAFWPERILRQRKQTTNDNDEDDFKERQRNTKKIPFAKP